MTLAFELAQLLAQLLDAHADHAAVEFDLLLARATGLGQAAPLAFEVGPAPYEPSREVLEAGQFDLQPALATLGALAEDVEDERGAIDHCAVERPLEVALLRRRQGRVEHHQTRLCADDG